MKPRMIATRSLPGIVAATALLAQAACQSGSTSDEASGSGAARSSDMHGASGASPSAPVDAGSGASPDGGRSSGGQPSGNGSGASDAPPCCQVSDSPGCSDPGIEQCVCAIRPECCSDGWGESCVQIVTEKRCEVGVRKCVCEDWEQQQCCDGEWGEFCQVTAEEKCDAAPGCGNLSGGSGGSSGRADAGAAGAGGGGGDTKKPCCQTSDTPGCADPAIEQCVCDKVPDCCDEQWDEVCVQLVNEKHCEDGIRQCVCEEWQQPQCCDTQWTSFCSVTAEEKCGAEPACR